MDRFDVCIELVLYLYGTAEINGYSDGIGGIHRRLDVFDNVLVATYDIGQLFDEVGSVGHPGIG